MRVKVAIGAAIGVGLSAGCTLILGIDGGDYRVVDAGTGGASATSSSTTTTTSTASSGTTTSSSAGGAGGMGGSTGGTGGGDAGPDGGEDAGPDCGDVNAGGGPEVGCAACKPGLRRCAGETWERCVNGTWQPIAPQCPGTTTFCKADHTQNTLICVPPPSCPLGDGGTGPTCGSMGESCCASPMVDNDAFASFERSYDGDTFVDASNPARVHSFRLDAFEVTVGRFRQFYNAYPGSKPADEAGAHPRIANSGWRSPAWDGNLAAGQNSLNAYMINNCGGHTWTTTPGSNEDKPINCVTWYEAFAFCAWDGGRLPTEAEWNFAAAGGAQQRKVAWWNAADPATQVIDEGHAVYACSADGDAGCNPFTDLRPVGSVPTGAGLWGQVDLAGNVREWTLDWYAPPYPSGCVDCANLGTPDSTMTRVVRGGSWKSAESGLLSAARDHAVPTGASASPRDPTMGIRCARDL